MTTRLHLSAVLAALLLISCTPQDPNPDAGVTFTLGGTVTGLAGTGLVLQNNLGDDLAITANGAFTFATALPSGSDYVVTVKTQPSAPAQVCQVLNYTGTVTDANVTTISVTCTYAAYLVGGTVTGLSGTGLVLQNTLADDLAVTANGSFTFATPVVTGGGYGVTVKAQPTAPTQTCVVSNGTGTVTSSPITHVAVTCATNTYSVGGAVTGLTGTGLVLQNNGADELAVASDGQFTFAAPVASGTPYAVAVKTQPTAPSQTCAVTGGAGTVASSPITHVAVTCTTNTYSVGGAVTGLTGTGLVLQNNAGDDLAIAANGAFTFSTALADTTAYAVTVRTQPSSPAQRCLVTNGSGALSGSDVANVSVACMYTINGTVTGLAGTGLVLRNNGADDLAISTNGVFTFAAPMSEGSSYVVTVRTQPSSPPQACTITNGAGWVGTGPVTSIAVACANVYALGGTVSGFTSGMVLTSPGLPDLPVGDGVTTFSFPTPVPTGTAYAVAVKTPPSGASCTVTNGSGTIAGADVTNISVRCSRAWTFIACGQTHSAGVVADGTLWAWGDNYYGQLGDGTNNDSLAPVRIGAGYSSVAASETHTVAIKTDHTLWAWGHNDNGQLGTGDNTNRNTPVQIGTGFAMVAAGFGHTVAVKVDGTLWAWGYNYYGQLGTGNTTDRNAPVQVGADYAMVAAGETYTVALKLDGTLWAWGENSYGQLGTGDNTNRTTPAQIGIDYAMVAAGTNHAVAVKMDGTLWTWGHNSYGQLGTGNTTDRNAPVQIGTGYAMATAGQNHTLAVKTNGTLWAWGGNGGGQLGDGTLVDKTTPVQTGTGYAAGAAGQVHTVARKANDALWVWGNNGYGQLGDGTMTSRRSPVEIP